MLPVREVSREEYRARLLLLRIISLVGGVIVIIFDVWAFAVGKTGAGLLMLAVLVFSAAALATGTVVGRRKGRL